MQKNESFHFSPIGFVQSTFKNKFGVPRQPGLMNSSKATIKLGKDPDLKTALKSLEEFSHLWVIFVFHAHGGNKWKPSIRPPRLGGNKKVGVLASRSPHRPNPIGISVVKIEQIDFEAKDGPEILISGHDLLDQTPVLDIKPYITYADSISEAVSGWAATPVPRFAVNWSELALTHLKKICDDKSLNLAEYQEAISDFLELDPRPAFQKRNNAVEDSQNEGLKYGFSFEFLDVKYTLHKGGFLITEILLLDK